MTQESILVWVCDIKVVNFFSRRPDLKKIYGIRENESFPYGGLRGIFNVGAVREPPLLPLCDYIVIRK
jgi:hypothetical protein